MKQWPADRDGIVDAATVHKIDTVHALSPVNPAGRGVLRGRGGSTVSKSSDELARSVSAFFLVFPRDFSTMHSEDNVPSGRASCQLGAIGGRSGFLFVLSYDGYTLWEVSMITDTVCSHENGDDLHHDGLQVMRKSTSMSADSVSTERGKLAFQLQDI